MFIRKSQVAHLRDLDRLKYAANDINDQAATYATLKAREPNQADRSLAMVAYKKTHARLKNATFEPLPVLCSTRKATAVASIGPEPVRSIVTAVDTALVSFKPKAPR